MAPKYQMSSNDSDIYKTELSLNITLNDPADFGSYYCISKNEKGLTKAVVEMFGKYTTVGKTGSLPWGLGAES